MICYRDATFCAAADKCATKDCPSRLSALDAEMAHSMDIPVALADFSKTCGKYKEKKDGRQGNA